MRARARGRERERKVLFASLSIESIYAFDVFFSFFSSIVRPYIFSWQQVFSRRRRRRLRPRLPPRRRRRRYRHLLFLLRYLNRS